MSGAVGWLWLALAAAAWWAIARGAASRGHGWFSRHVLAGFTVGMLALILAVGWSVVR